MCCDLCHPDSFLFLAVKESPQSEPRAATKYKIPSSYTMSAREQQLTQLLLAWAEKEAASLCGPDAVFGTMGLIGDSTIDRIVALAAAGVLNSVASLEREVDWYYMKVYGSKVLEFAKQTHPDQTNAASSTRPMQTPYPTLQVPRVPPTSLQDPPLLPRPALHQVQVSSSEDKSWPFTRALPLSVVRKCRS